MRLPLFQNLTFPKFCLTYFACILFLCTAAQAQNGKNASKEVCIYKNNAGHFVQVNSKVEIPPNYRKGSRCFARKSSDTKLARPEDIDLSGSIRREDLSTSIGRMQIRWPRSAEVAFGRTPLRAVTDSAQTVARTLRTAAFPPAIQDLNITWQIVFIGDEVPKHQIPLNLITGCHPGWMTPPGNLYFPTKAITDHCGENRRVSASVADAELAEVILHEMGHVVEFHLLAQHYRADRLRAEGFATWFEMYAAKYSSEVSESKLRKRTHRLARRAIQNSPNAFVFGGSAGDYARASMYFGAIVDKRGVRGLMDVYASITKKNLSFFDAVKEEIYWNREQLEKEAVKFAHRY